MPRALLPGRWNRHGRAVPDPQASELDNVYPLRHDMPQVPPQRCRVTQRGRALLWTLLINTIALTSFAALLLAARHH